MKDKDTSPAQMLDIVLNWFTLNYTDFKGSITSRSGVTELQVMNDIIEHYNPELNTSEASYETLGLFEQLEADKYIYGYNPWFWQQGIFSNIRW